MVTECFWIKWKFLLRRRTSLVCDGTLANGSCGMTLPSVGGSIIKGLSKTKLSRCGIVLQEKYSWREQNGINRGGQSTAVKHGQGSQRQRAPDVHGANRSSLG